MVLESNVAGVVHTVTIYLGSIVMLHRTPFGRSDRIRIYSLPSSVTTTARCTASFAQDRTAKHVGQVQPKGVGSSRYGLLGRMDGPADFGRPTSDTMHRSNAQVRADPNPPVLPYIVERSAVAYRVGEVVCTQRGCCSCCCSWALTLARRLGSRCVV